MVQTRIAYDENAIKTLDPLAHIRLRTGMYIGRLGDGSNPDDGIYVLLKEVVDNAIDEFIMGEGKRIDVRRDGDRVEVRDYGRGIPLGKVVDCVSKMHTGGKYNDDVFQFSVGLNGVGTKAVNALSSRFEVCSWRDGRYKRAAFARGKKVEEKSGRERQKNGTYVAFVPDEEIFGAYRWEEELIEHRLRYYAFLNTGLVLTYNGKRFTSKEGLKDLLREELGDESGIYPIVHHREDRLEFAFTHTNNYGETYFSFVNGQHTSDGGTHQSAFREGILKGINEFAKKTFAGSDVRDGIIGAVAVKLQDPVFESQTKNKLGSTDVRGWIVQAVKDAVQVWLHKEPETAKTLIEKIEANERLRKELQAVKKEAKARAKKTAIRIPKLIDCKIHRGDKNPRAAESSIFLTEGDSAGGSMVQARDVDTQAIFALRGKPLNCHGQKRDAIYKNEELYNIMRALDVEDDVDNLRYNKVVIATDADVDGMHIRNLLLTYFLRYFEELVARGHVYLFETPLFRVRNKKETRYCYNEAERDRAIEELSQPEVTRFKGLGEISPKELKRFMTGDMRLINVRMHSVSEVSKALEFYMGKNTPERKAFIVDNLVTDVA
ncbi:MAG: type IIA DNA topoisomerase subunit B [Acidobacteria bacterium]|nr:MAG: type IIA DNA topoisomerase subunit B [Acidobacteriota bacterium]